MRGYLMSSFSIWLWVLGASFSLKLKGARFIFKDLFSIILQMAPSTILILCWQLQLEGHKIAQLVVLIVANC
ncbi:Uncharacterised protein [Legionella hackeliae]|nr:hypothetical protein Lhac_2685 [Legionella hackeliae]STX49725.1 Uncharacterised protein [Legionella hackeliae]